MTTRILVGVATGRVEREPASDGSPVRSRRSVAVTTVTSTRTAAVATTARLVSSMDIPSSPGGDQSPPALICAPRLRDQAGPGATCVRRPPAGGGAGGPGHAQV